MYLRPPLVHGAIFLLMLPRCLANDWLSSSFWFVVSGG